MKSSLYLHKAEHECSAFIILLDKFFNFENIKLVLTILKQKQLK